MPGKALLIVSGHNQLGETEGKTGFWWEELVAPYYEFTENGFRAVIASPEGGKPLPDPKSETDALDDPEVITLVNRFKEDAEAMRKLESTIPLREVDPDDYAIAFVVGGHGAMWDLANNDEIRRIFRRMMQREAVVSAVCHGPAAFKGVTLEDGRSILEGRKVTGFSNVEEEQVGLTEVVPFSLEDMMREGGAEFSAADPWQPFAVADGNLVTGQNPASSRETARRAVEAAQGAPSQR